MALIVAAIRMFVQRKTQERIDRASTSARAQARRRRRGRRSEADPLIREANARLAQSKAGAGVANLPMIFVDRRPGTAKTSTILNSGLEPELLAGQVYQDNAVAPTRAANIFFARDTVFVEAGGALMANPPAWTRLVEKLAAVAPEIDGRQRAGAARRAAVLRSGNLHAAGAAEAIANATRYLQARLGEISQILGISYPGVRAVHARRPASVFRGICPQSEPGGSGASGGRDPADASAAASGVYAEEETQRLTGAFNQLFHSFCDHRLLLLPREGDARSCRRPTNFRANSASCAIRWCNSWWTSAVPASCAPVRFCADFIFPECGRWPRRRLPCRLVAPTTPAEQAEVGGATRMFRAGFQAEQKRAARRWRRPAADAGRRVPQWLFLGHLFNDVILADAQRARGQRIQHQDQPRQADLARLGRGDSACFIRACCMVVFRKSRPGAGRADGRRKGFPRRKARAARCRESIRCRSSKRCASRWRN